jgi:hypothetical protein
MSKTAITVLTIVGIIVGIAVLLATSLAFGYVNFGNEANRSENGIVAAWTNNKNVYDNGWKTVMEKAQVPKEYIGQMKDVYDGVMKGRYGPNGSQALLQFIKEQNPTIDASVYRDIQQAVEIFHNQFAQAQTELVSRKQEYQNLLTGTMHGRFYNLVAHYPHIDLSKYDIVTSTKTEQDFDTKRAPELNLFNK